MQVALPEVDGRIMTRAISFKAAGRYDQATQCNIVEPQPEPGRVAFVADLAANWVKLRRKPAAERRVAIILANYPNRDGRIGNGVGLDTPAGVVEALRADEGGWLRGRRYSGQRRRFDRAPARRADQCACAQR